MSKHCGHCYYHVLILYHCSICLREVQRSCSLSATAELLVVIDCCRFLNSDLIAELIICVTAVICGVRIVCVVLCVCVGAVISYDHVVCIVCIL